MSLSERIKKIKRSKTFRKASEFAVLHKRGIKIFILASIAGGMIINGIMQQPQIIANKEEKKELMEAMKYEDERVEEVERLNEIVGTDEYVEKVARDKLGMVKEDEKLFVDVEKED